uniref:Uncharacterized protein n=1 Tax=Eutreptiella gymnastica TaxID=73025 RepID=A0A7S1I9L6_9EUGL
MAPVSPQPPRRTYADALVATAGLTGLVLVWLGARDLAAPPTALRTTTVDVGVAQGGTGLEAGVEWDKDGRDRTYGTVTGSAPFGSWRAGLAKDREGVVTQTADVIHEAGSTAFKVGLKRALGDAWRWKAGTSHTGVLRGGSRTEPSAAGAGGAPPVWTADIGTSEDGVKWTAGVKSSDGELSARLGISGSRDEDNSWAIGVESGSTGGGRWSVSANAGHQ